MNKVEVEINNLAGLEIEDGFFQKIAEEAIGAGEVACLESKKIRISLAVVSEDEISRINAEYRSKKEPTDVLSFSEYGNISDLCHNDEEEIFLGELLICPDYIFESAKLQNVSFEFELAYIFSHGILHLLGFDHGEKMFSLQENVAKNITK